MTVGFDGGLLGEAGVSYAGVNAAARARLAREILIERCERVEGLAGNYRADLVGLNSLHATAGVPESESQDVRLRVAVRSMDREVVDTLLWETESLLCCGPAGGGGYRGQVTPGVVTHSTLIDRARVTHDVKVYTA